MPGENRTAHIPTVLPPAFAIGAYYHSDAHKAKASKWRTWSTAAFGFLAKMVAHPIIIVAIVPFMSNHPTPYILIATVMLPVDVSSVAQRARSRYLIPKVTPTGSTDSPSQG